MKKRKKPLDRVYASDLIALDDWLEKLYERDFKATRMPPEIAGIISLMLER